MSEGGLLKRSGQYWKMWTWPVITWLGLVVLFMGVRQPAPQADAPGWPLLLIMIGLAIAGGSLIWACLSIRCPACRAKLLWRAVRERGPQNSLFWILRIERCPACGNDGGPRGDMGAGR
jgi:hypothetical protein